MRWRRSSGERGDSLAAPKRCSRRGKRGPGEAYGDGMCRIDQRRRVYKILLLGMVAALTALERPRRLRAVRFRSLTARHLRHRGGIHVGHTGQQGRRRHRHTDGKNDESRESARASHRTNCDPNPRVCQTPMPALAKMGSPRPRCNLVANGPAKHGRDDRIRTCDPLTPSQVRYQAAPHPVGRNSA
jgi:hypothetical protein